MSEEFEERWEEEDEEELLLEQRGGRERENVLWLASVSGIMPPSLSLSALLSLPISRPPLFPNSYNLVVEDSFLKYFYAPLS